MIKFYMNRMDECMHNDVSGCGINCECYCENCQAHYEDNWSKRVINEHLCPGCGVPLTLTPETLVKTQHIHFFDPCTVCSPAFKACMAMANLCETCHSYVEGECVNCKCEETATCNCRQCQAFRTSIQNSSRGAR
jgi:hypothetical protein